MHDYICCTALLVASQQLQTLAAADASILNSWELVAAKAPGQPPHLDHRRRLRSAAIRSCCSCFVAAAAAGATVPPTWPMELPLRAARSMGSMRQHLMSVTSGPWRFWSRSCVTHVSR